MRVHTLWHSLLIHPESHCEVEVLYALKSWILRAYFVKMSWKHGLFPRCMVEWRYSVAVTRNIRNVSNKGSQIHYCTLDALALLFLIISYNCTRVGSGTAAWSISQPAFDKFLQRRLVMLSWRLSSRALSLKTCNDFLRRDTNHTRFS